VREGREVWITGAGMVSPLGGSLEDSWRGVRGGRTGVARHPRPEGSSFPERFLYHGDVAGFEEPPEVPPKLASQRKFLNRGSILGLHAAKEAFAQAGADPASLPPGRKALYIGSGDFTRLGNLDFYAALRQTAGPGWAEPAAEALNEAALHQVNPFFLLEGLANNLFSYLSALYEIMGPNGSFSSLSATGSQALEYCERVLRLGEADLGLVVGCGCWSSPIILFELDGLGILSRAVDGAASFRPFDRRRDGFFPAEGAAALVLEPAEAARARGARPLGRVLGTGNFQELSPERNLAVPREAAGRACREALAEAGLPLREAAFILPHGNGTPRGDGAELSALRELFAGEGASPPLSGLKPYTGHMGAASDLGEILFGLHALREGVLPPTPGFERADKGLEELDIPASPRPVRGGAFLSLSLGLGGQASATLVGAP